MVLLNDSILNNLTSLFAIILSSFFFFFDSVNPLLCFSKILGLKVITWVNLDLNDLFTFGLSAIILLILLLLAATVCWASSLLNPNNILSFNWKDFFLFILPFSPRNLGSFADIFPSIYCFMKLSPEGFTLFLNVLAGKILSVFLISKPSSKLNSLKSSNIMLLKLVMTNCLFIFWVLPINKLVKLTMFFLIFLKFFFISPNSLIKSFFIPFTLSIFFVFSSKTKFLSLASSFFLSSILEFTSCNKEFILLFNSSYNLSNLSSNSWYLVAIKFDNLYSNDLILVSNCPVLVSTFLFSKFNSVAFCLFPEKALFISSLL